MSAENHIKRSKRSHHNYKMPSKDLAYHGKFMDIFSEKNNNKNRMPSWESRFGKYKKESWYEIRRDKSVNEE